MESRYLTLEEVLVIHHDQIERHGGSHGVRDVGLLESALAQPRQVVFGEILNGGIPAKAAAYLFHIVKNHPFLDGNKRTGTLAAIVFLGLNGEPSRFVEGKLESLVLSVAAGKAGKEEVARFFAEEPLAE